jgi:hypothetical protein
VCRNGTPREYADKGGIQPRNEERNQREVPGSEMAGGQNMSGGYQRREGFPTNDGPPSERRVWRPGMVMVGRCYPCGVEEFINQEQLQTQHSERHGDEYCCHHYRKEAVDETRLAAHYTRTRHRWSPGILGDELLEFEGGKRSSKVCSGRDDDYEIDMVLRSLGETKFNGAKDSSRRLSCSG